MDVLSPQREVVLRVCGLDVVRGTRGILSGVNLSVHRGETLVIMGVSGSGKSTLLRSMIGALVPTCGKVEVFHQDIYQLDEDSLNAIRKRFGVLFQSGALFSSMTVGENVALPLREHARVDEATLRIMVRLKLELVNLAGFENLMPAQLSGGMIKRAALARAIALDPRLLFFDEPSAGLDPVISAELDETILMLRDALKMTIIVVTHELDSAFKIADRITVLDAGEVLMTGTVEEIRAAEQPRIRDLLNRRPHPAEVDAEAYLQRLTEETARL